ncbi:MAG: hypothetical protein RR498_16505 [Hafnia sp.]
MGNTVSDPLISTVYANDHWGITFHSMVYHSLMADNIVTACAGIAAQFFSDEVIVEGNKVTSYLFNAACNNNVTYVGNDFSCIIGSLLQGNNRFVSKSTQFRIRGGAQSFCLAIISGAKPFGFSGFKVINSASHEFIRDEFVVTVTNTFVNPKTLMADPNSAGNNAVFPTNDAHLSGLTAGLYIYDARVGSVRGNGYNFNNLNYGVSAYKNTTSSSSTYLDISNSSFETDVGICLRGTSSTSFFSGQAKNCSFLGTIGVINANTNGYAVVSCNFRTAGMSAILVASNLAYAFGITMSTDCVVNGSVLTGFKWYDFNGYQFSYDRTVTYAKPSVLPVGYWWYAPDENVGISANMPFEYAKGGSTGGGVILKKALTITQVV